MGSKRTACDVVKFIVCGYFDFTARNFVSVNFEHDVF